MNAGGCLPGVVSYITRFTVVCIDNMLVMANLALTFLVKLDTGLSVPLIDRINQISGTQNLTSTGANCCEIRHEYLKPALVHPLYIYEIDKGL